MGGAQPLAVTMNEGVALCVEVDRDRIRRRLETRYLDEEADDLADAVERCLRAKRERRPLSVGLCANAAEVLPELLRQGFEADVVTDQTSAHDPLVGYVPADLTLAEADALRRDDPEEYIRRARVSAAAHCFAMVGFMDAGAEVFDYGNSLRAEAKLGGFERAFDYPGFVPAYIRPLFCEGKGPFRWVALSGDPRDIAATDRAVLDEFPEDESLARWIRMAGERIAFQGLPARICWLGYGERRRLGLRFNEMVASGELSAPIVIGRDHLDSGSVASPYRETESMLDGSDAIADWPLLNALVNTAVRGLVGQHPSRWRRGDRTLDPRRHGVRGRWVRARRREARPRAHRRPRHRRDAPCRRGLRPRDRGRGGARGPHPDARARRVSRREIVEIGHPVLRERAREVTSEELQSESVQGLIDDMIETMRAADGAGLAANQVGETVRVAVVEVRPGNPRYPYKPPVPLTVIVNPVIEPLDEEIAQINEGCLSVPNLRGEVPRHVNIRLRYLDRDGAEHDEVRRGLTAGTFQHELDHLDGALFVDRVSDPAHAHHLGAVRALPPGRVRGARAQARGAGRARDDLLVRAGMAGRARRGGGRRGGGRGRPDHGGVRRGAGAARGRAESRGPHAAGPRQRAFARVPARAARPHPARKRLLLDLARADVRAGRAARSRALSGASRARHTPRWRSPASRPSASSTTCTTVPTARPTATGTRWAAR